MAAAPPSGYMPKSIGYANKAMVSAANLLAVKAEAAIDAAIAV